MTSLLRIVQDVQIRRRMIAVSQHDLLQVLRHVLTVFAAEIRRLKRGLDAQLPAIPFLLRFVEPQLLCVPVRPVLILGKHIFLQTILGDPRALEQRKTSRVCSCSALSRSACACRSASL